MSDVALDRLRIAERLLIGAAAERPELLTDDNWQAAMGNVYAMLKKCNGDSKSFGDGYEITQLKS